MGSRLHSIREACSLESEMRGEDSINDILDFVKDVKFFARLSVLQQRSLCRTMSLEEFGPREFVFQMGEHGDCFYIILAGSVGVQVHSQTAPCPNDVHSEKCDCPNRPLETVVFLEKGMGFGELALQSDQPRSASIQTSEKTELLVTKRADYEMYAGQQHRQFIEQRVKFLRQCPRIEDALQMGLVSTQDIAAMANCLNEVQLSGNAPACKQGDVVDHMIFVRSGQLASLRCVDLESVQQQNREALALKEKEKGFKQRTTITARDNAKSAAQELQKDAGTRRESDTIQPQWQLTQNLAKAMMEMKRKDRQARLTTIELQKVKEDEDGTPVIAEKKEDGKEELSPRSGTESEGGAPGETRVKAKNMWSRIQVSIKAANVLEKFVGGTEEAAGGGKESQADAAHANIEHFASVQAARKRYTQYNFKKKTDADRKVRHPVSAARRSVSIKRASVASVAKIDNFPNMAAKKRVRILRIGTIGPFEYFGDQQVCGNEKYPVSLVSDPVAEIYVMSKHDILRRVPKKLFPLLFNLEKEAVPSDQQLLDMYKQTERWNAFRRSMHGEALGNLTARSQMTGVGMRGHSSGSRVDAVANLEFLGVNPHSNLGESLLPLPQNKGVALTPKDEELFSQASARFLRRFDIMKRDPGLREALGKAGLMRNSRLHDGLPGSALDDDDQDPMAFRFDQHWYKLQKDPIGLDLDDVLSEDSGKQLAAATIASSSNTDSRSRSSVRVATRRPSQLAESHNKRASASGSGGPGHSGGSAAGSVGSYNGVELGDDLLPRPPAAVRSSYSSAGPAPPATGLSLPASTAAKRRQSTRQGSEAMNSSVELPPLDSARDGKSSPRPAAAANSSSRRIVGFSES